MVNDSKNTLPLKSFVPHSTNFTQHLTLTTNGQTSYRQLRTHLDRDSHIHLNFALISCSMFMIVLFTYIFGHLIRYPILTLKHSPSHLIHMSYSHLHISDHFIPLSHYTSSHFSLYHTHTTIITHLLSHLILLNTMHLNSPTII